MEVKSIGQGGQVSFDNIKVDKTAGGDALVQSSPAPVSENQQNTHNTNHKPSEKEIKDALDKLKKFIEDDNTKIEYEYHSKFNDLMIKIIDKETKQVVLEVPPKKNPRSYCKDDGDGWRIV